MKGVLIEVPRATDIVEKLFCTTPISRPNFRDDDNYFQSTQTLEKCTSNEQNWKPLVGLQATPEKLRPRLRVLPTVGPQGDYLAPSQVIDNVSTNM